VGTVGLTNQDLYAPSIALNPAPLLVVLGPTSTGKSVLALHLAQALRGEIVSCDSVQVYSGLEIGSAKLPPRERRGIPHHLMDIVGPGGELTAGAYASLARAALADLKARGLLPIVAGGTGFYLRALLDGLSPAPPRDNQLRVRLAALTRRRPMALHRFLRRHDPAAAARIHENDHQKLIRAIELTRVAGQPASRVQSLPRPGLNGFRVLQIGLQPPRGLLQRAVNARSEEMFRGGLIEETRALLESGLDPAAKSLQSLGYKQAVEFLSGQLPLAEAVRQCQTKTRQYAKRQMTWFRADPTIHWLSGFGSDSAIQEQALALARDHAKSEVPNRTVT
jgi:tRNA dimethylallyltransferase